MPEPAIEIRHILDRLHALEGVRAIELATRQYEEKFGVRPKSLDDIVSRGLLAALPPNPYNLAYCMDKDGIIYFDNPQCQTSPSSLESH